MKIIFFYKIEKNDYKLIKSENNLIFPFLGNIIIIFLFIK